MIFYTIVMFAVAAVFAVMAVLIYMGKTSLIHDYHQNKVTDHAAYGKAFGKTMSGLAATMAMSGLIALFGESVIWVAVAVLAVGLIAGIAAIVWIQKKYNGGVFG